MCDGDVLYEARALPLRSRRHMTWLNKNYKNGAQNEGIVFKWKT